MCLTLLQPISGRFNYEERRTSVSLKNNPVQEDTSSIRVGGEVVHH